MKMRSNLHLSHGLEKKIEKKTRIISSMNMLAAAAFVEGQLIFVRKKALV